MELFLHLWDEIDDLAGVCRHLATSTAAEIGGVAAPLVAAASEVLLAGAATLLLAQRHLLNFSA